MHSALVVFLSVLLYSSMTAGLYLPQAWLSRSASASPTVPAKDVHDKCTFTVWHKQICRASIKHNYIQINELIDHPNDIVIDIASYRPTTARNSYSKVSSTQAFAIQGLLDNRNLTLYGENGSDLITFEYDGLRGSSDMEKISQAAYCDTGAWDIDAWNCDKNSRERRLDCAFRCEAVDDEDRDSSNIELR